jgi:hypothetical protein
MGNDGFGEGEQMIYFTLQEMMAVRAERDDFERKGKELCSAYGNSLITIHDLRKQIATRTAPVSDEEWRLTGSGIGNQTVAWRFEVDRLLAARDKADDVVKENK